jgi:hypothetical protein
MPPRNDAPWSPREGRPDRQAAFRPLRRVLIVCEDEKSSKLYFDQFPIDRRRIDIRTVGTGRNTDSLVEYAAELKRAAIRRRDPYNEVFSVFDRDSFPAQNFNRALQISRNENIRPIWANEAFELWYLLHFDFVNTAIPRAQYAEMFQRRVGLEYQKNDASIYQRLREHQPTAIRNAARLKKHWIETRQRGCDPERCNPSTNLQDLVEFLNQLVELGTADEGAISDEDQGGD